MNIKTILLAACTLLAATANAQDKIYKRNGNVIDAKVSEVSTREITYKKADNPEGPTYKIGKNEVARIEYENGSEDVFGYRGEERKPEKVEKRKYGKNILALAPLQITDGIGVGLSYERVLDKRGIISFYLPAMVGFNNNNNSDIFPFSGNYSSSYYYYNDDYTSYTAMPGVKIYPTGSKGKVRYAVGPSIAVTYSKRTGDYYMGLDYYGNPIYAARSQERFALGVVINNSLNMYPTPHLLIGLELGLGMTYLNQYNGVNNNGEDFIGQFAFKIGYRF